MGAGELEETYGVVDQLPRPAHRADASACSGRPARRYARSVPTIIVLTEDALKPIDVESITTLHGDEPLTIQVLVPADTERNVVADFINHLSLFELREAWDAVTEKEDAAQARQEASASPASGS